jgi:DNA-binding transcriptional LysR family regulator
MYPAISQALDALRRSLSEASAFDPAQSTRQFRISIPHPMGPFYALALRAATAAISPGIVLSYETVSLPIDLQDKLRDGTVDLAVDWLPVASDPFVNQRIFDDRLVLLARGAHPSVGPSFTIEDLRRHGFVSLHRRGEIEHLPQAIAELYRQDLRVVVRISELLEIPAVVAGTDLLGIFPASMGPMMQQRLGLQVLEIPVQLSPVPIYMIWHQSRRADAAHRWLREIVVAELGRHADA